MTVPKSQSGAEGFSAPEGSIIDDDMASRRWTGGILDRGTFEQDTPVTWETLDRPWDSIRASGETGDQPPDAPLVNRCMSGRVRTSIGSRGKDPAREDRSEVRRGKGVGWPNKSDEVGERPAPDPAEQRGPVPEENL